jgi:hypothetical protein
MVSSRIQVVAVLFSVLFLQGGCATKNSEIKNANLQSAESLKDFLLTKNASLDCTSYSCFAELTDNETRFRMLYESEQWEKLSREILQVNVGNELTYFYLGRAAEGLGLNEIAIRYYLLAKTHPAKCLSLFNACGGLEFPKVIEERMRIVSVKPKSEQASAKKSLNLNNLENENPDLLLEKNSKKQKKSESPIKTSGQSFFIDVSNTIPDANGFFEILVRSNVDIAAIEVNGERQNLTIGKEVVLKRLAKVGSEISYTIVALDANGNKDSKSVLVSRKIVEQVTLYAQLNPALVKRQPERDAVAVIIGIADYKNLPRADYANDDARVFYDYAIRALGVKPENIKLLVDADADEVGIYRAFKTWLPSRVRSSTDVYVYYSGHGLPTADGRGLYVLPQRADRDFIDKTAITQAEINVAIQAAKPKSVTVFLDACYSGQARTGETLLASARPVSLKADTTTFPDGFTVITASRGDQISSSSPELKHGIFSYYLMRGMEGDADANRDGKITVGEMQTYLADNVSRQAGMMNRRQEPQIIGDRSRVLVGR